MADESELTRCLGEHKNPGPPAYSVALSVNGRRITSCPTLAVMHNGDDILTIEGLGSPDALHPLHAAFIERDAFQCGPSPNALFNATGVRVREFPITLDKLLPALRGIEAT